MQTDARSGAEARARGRADAARYSLVLCLAAAACVPAAVPPRTAPAPSTGAPNVADSIHVAPASVATASNGDVRLVDYRFYTGKTYGSEAEFNPLTEILNEGFDVLSLSGQDRHVFHRELGADAINVLRSVLHARKTYDAYGWRQAVMAEVIPFSGSPAGPKWVSNYQLHLFGSGMVSRRLSEWFDYHGFAHPDLLAAATLMTAHFTNEIVENQGARNALNEDATTDLLVFDVAGIVLWRTQWMQRAFSGSVRLTNWPGQPSVNPSSGTLENTGQYFVLRGPIPHTNGWRGFYLFGESTLLGVSRGLGNGRALSLGFGLGSGTSPMTGAESTRVRPKAGLFYDRDGSLLWSITAGSPPGYASWLSLNTYPGALRIGGVSPGFWMQLPKRGGVRFGLASSWGVGVGGGSAR